MHECRCEMRLHALDDLQALAGELAQVDILANATPVGMGSAAGLSPLPDRSLLRPGMVVADMIYAPEHTALMEDAEALG